LRTLNTPLQAEGLSRRVYPFIGLAIVGLVSFHGFAAITSSLALSGAMALGVRDRVDPVGLDAPRPVAARVPGSGLGSHRAIIHGSGRLRCAR